VPPRGNHRPGRAQDGHQRLQLGRRQLHDRLRGFQLAELGQPDQRPDQPVRRHPPHHLAGTNGKSYKLNDKIATLVVRPRGWHLDEKHVTVDGKRVSGGIFDFALFLFHNAKEQIARGAGPFFYLPKMESTWKRACGTTSS
jgi:hypothetical protein